MLENIRLSLKGIWSHKLRSFLTMLGIIIGIAAIMAIVSTIKGTNEQIKQNLIGSGNNAVTIQLYRDGWPIDFSYESIPDGIPRLTDDVERELGEIRGAEGVTFFHKRENSESLYYGNTMITGCTVYGIGSSYMKTAGLTVTMGKGFSEKDLTSSRKIALVDNVTMDASFGGSSPVGKTIDINGETFTVVGVVEKRSSFEPVIQSLEDYYTYNQNTNGSIFIPDQMWPTVYQYDEPQSIMIRAASTDDMTYVGKRAENYLNARIKNGSESVSYQSDDLADSAQQLQQLSQSSNVMLVGIASISLLVGGIGVMNIMLVSVTERTREIGLKKALGAKKRTILRQFLTEAAMLSLIGGLIGIVAGIVLSKIISVVAMVPVSISIPATVLAVAFSMLVGIIFGLVPSVKASNLNPIDALRYE